MSKPYATAVLLLTTATGVASGGAGVAPAPHHLVACAPGYPGNMSQAQPTMDEFAAMVTAAAGWPAESLTAEYHQDEERGIARMHATDTDLALVPLPFFLEHEQALQLEAVLQVVQQNGQATETWSLVAPTGKVDGPEDLQGWEITGVPAYAPGFVRGPALGAWGRLPERADIVFTRRVLGALRRALAGDQVAVLLDSAQTAALDDLPDIAALEIVATSEELIGAVVATVGGRIEQDQVDALVRGLLSVHEQSRFGQVLEMLRLSRFEPLDTDALDRARSAFLDT